MARASADDACIICEQAPCTCRKKKAAPRATPRLPQETVIDAVLPVEDVRPSAIDRMRARVQQEALDRLFALPPDPYVNTTGRLSEEDAAMLHAVRTLSAAFEINPDDLAPFKRHLDQPATTHERASWWKARRRNDA